MSISKSNRRNKMQSQLTRIRQMKTGKTAVEDAFPFEVPNLDQLSPEIKQFVNELEREYIERYNVLINNRRIFQEIVENISTQLDEKGVTAQTMGKTYTTVAIQEPKNQQTGMFGQF